MPNWCNNFVEITGNINELVKDIETIKESQESNFFYSLVGNGYSIFEGYDHFKNIPLFQVIGKVNGYIGEWHENREEAVKEMNDEYNKNWYETNCEYFGTKWDISPNEAINDIREKEITLSFASAWSPPINFCKLLSEKYKVNVSIFYSECGCNFAGKTTIVNGEIVNDEDYTYMEGLYNLSNEEFWHELEYHIEYALDEEQSAEEFISDYPFMEETCKGIAIKMYQAEQETRNRIEREIKNKLSIN